MTQKSRNEEEENEEAGVKKTGEAKERGWDEGEGENEGKRKKRS
jgi:hypothetical protein